MSFVSAVRAPFHFKGTLCFVRGCLREASCSLPWQNGERSWLFAVGGGRTSTFSKTSQRMCWMRYAPTASQFGVPPLLCVAFGVWLSRTMWDKSPTLATRFYNRCVPSPTRNAGGSFVVGGQSMWFAVWTSRVRKMSLLGGCCPHLRLGGVLPWCR
jgi:hypothetical protein